MVRMHADRGCLANLHPWKACIQELHTEGVPDGRWLSMFAFPGSLCHPVRGGLLVARFQGCQSASMFDPLSRAPLATFYGAFGVARDMSEFSQGNQKPQSAVCRRSEP